MTEGNPEKTKQELFNEDPDRFEDLRELMLAVKKNNGNWFVMINRLTFEELYIVQGLVNDRLKERRDLMNIENMNKSKIVKPSSGFLNGIRNMRK